MKFDFDNKDYERHKRIAFYIGCAAAIATALFVSVKYLFFPFFAAWLTALLLDGAAGAICKKTKMPRLVVSIFLALIILALLAAVLLFIGKGYIRRLLSFFKPLPEMAAFCLTKRG